MSDAHDAADRATGGEGLPRYDLPLLVCKQIMRYGVMPIYVMQLPESQLWHLAEVLSDQEKLHSHLAGAYERLNQFVGVLHEEAHAEAFRSAKEVIRNGLGS